MDETVTNLDDAYPGFHFTRDDSLKKFKNTARDYYLQNQHSPRNSNDSNKAGGRREKAPVATRCIWAAQRHEVILAAMEMIAYVLTGIVLILAVRTDRI